MKHQKIKTTLIEHLFDFNNWPVFVDLWLIYENSSAVCFFHVWVLSNFHVWETLQVSSITFFSIVSRLIIDFCMFNFIFYFWSKHVFEKHVKFQARCFLFDLYISFLVFLFFSRCGGQELLIISIVFYCFFFLLFLKNSPQTIRPALLRLSNCVCLLSFLYCLFFSLCEKTGVHESLQTNQKLEKKIKTNQPPPQNE